MYDMPLFQRFWDPARSGGFRKGSRRGYFAIVERLPLLILDLIVVNEGDRFHASDKAKEVSRAKDEVYEVLVVRSWMRAIRRFGASPTSASVGEFQSS